MRKALLALLVVILEASAAGAETAPCALQRVATAGPNVWLLCERRDGYVSSDEGKTWQARQIPSDARLRTIAFLDARRGFVAGDGGTLLATENGGEIWRQLSVPTKENLTSIQFVGDWGWLAGWAGVILHSKDAGRTWEKQETGVLQGIKSIFFVDREHGWAAGWAGTILRTTDGGKTWDQAKMPKTLWSLESIYFRDTKQGWAVGFAGQLLRSRDGGITWVEQECPVQAWLKSVAFDSKGSGWIVADNQALTSGDGGETWKSIAVPGTPFLQQVLPIKDSLWAVGQFGVVRSPAAGREFTVLATLPDVNREGGKS